MDRCRIWWDFLNSISHYNTLILTIFMYLKRFRKTINFRRKSVFAENGLFRVSAPPRSRLKLFASVNSRVFTSKKPYEPLVIIDGEQWQSFQNGWSNLRKNFFEKFAIANRFNDSTKCGRCWKETPSLLLRIFFFKNQ